jgi:ornithine cyclodeaminase/alanine dehydrogenase-like protein (mu-crystallin family)
VSGRTIVDFVVFDHANLRERFDQARTKANQDKIFITRADYLFSKSTGPGRENDREIVFFQSEGMGTQFAAVALKVYEKARENGLGQELPNKWFLQDVRT